MEIAILFLSFLASIGTWLPLIDSSHWIIRGQSYFKVFYLGLDLILLGLVIFFVPMGFLKVFTILLLTASIINCIKTILPFTKLSNVELPFTNEKQKVNGLSVLIFNVYQYNDRHKDLLDLVERVDPDVIFLIETNTEWARGLKELHESYPFHFDEILENTYGLMFMSKQEITEGGINYLVKPGIPSAEALINVNGAKVRILGLHPKPPIPGEALTTRFKDRELLQAQRYFAVQKEDDHQILVGDLNDVAWSRASLKFRELSGMKDPRVGRGFYSTFPTWSPIKIPLDHVFCSPEIELISFDVLENIGSDHYPIHVEFHLPNKK